MEHFLKLVADDLRQKLGNDLSRTIVIFPNKRASLFLNSFLVNNDDQIVWAPRYMSISEFFTSLTDITVADPIETVIRLYKHYCELTGSKESIDFFYGWGERILSDFDDLDKNLGDAEKIFRDLSDYQNIGSEMDFLTEEQTEQLRHFAGDFTTNKRTKIRESFRTLWDQLFPLYTRLRTELLSRGQAYEGQLYRLVLDGLKGGDVSLPDNVDTIAFVGFNVLDKVEKELFTFLRDKGKAKFYWDYDTHYMHEQTGVPTEAGTFLKENLRDFPNELSDERLFNNLTQRKEGEELRITYAMADTNAIQAQYVSNWLQSKKDLLQNDEEARRTAIVLCDETMLQPVLHALPTDDGIKVNITKGYPLSHTPAYTFIKCEMDKILSQRQDAATQRAKRGEPMPPLTKNEILRIFDALHGLVKDETLKAQKSTAEGSWNRTLYTEAHFLVYTTLTRFIRLVEQGELIAPDGKATIKLHTLFRLVEQALRSSTIPFHGEPAIGLQVMGVLETRCLDFDNLLLLSVNDGILPQKESDASFIPYLIRKHYGLTTFNKRTAVYAYYFFRLLQRAKNVTLAYNGTTCLSQKGEMSRFMSQMLIDEQLSGCISRIHLTTEPKPLPFTPEFVTTNVWQDVPLKKKFSPSAINTYMQCRLKFFFQYVKKFSVPKETDDVIDARDLGTVFHRTAELIYSTHLSSNGSAFTPEQIAHFLDNAGDPTLVQTIRQACKDEEVEWNELLESTVLLLIKQLLHYEANATDVVQTTLIAPEYEASTTLKVPYGNEGETIDIELSGYIDRLDVQQGTDGTRRLRIIDYKTGGTPNNDTTFAKLFPNAPINGKDESNYVRQTFMYSLMMLDHPHPKALEELPIQPLLYYVHRMNNKGFSPAISISGKKDSDDKKSSEKTLVCDFRRFADDFRKELTAVIAEIISPDTDFDTEGNGNKCTFCDFVKLCPRVKLSK